MQAWQSPGSGKDVERRDFFEKKLLGEAKWQKCFKACIILSIIMRDCAKKGESVK